MMCGEPIVVIDQCLDAIIMYVWKWKLISNNNYAQTILSYRSTLSSFITDLNWSDSVT